MNNNSVVVRIEMSGNRYNAWSADGTKYTSEISTGTRRGAYNKGMSVVLERMIGCIGGKFRWKCLRPVLLLLFLI